MRTALSHSGPARFWTKRVRTLEDRVKAMREHVVAGLRDPDMRRIALAVAAGDEWTLEDFAKSKGLHPFTHSPLAVCASKNEACELENVYTFVKGNVRYTGDITGIDTYVSARRTLFDFRGGDCDDAHVLISVLLGHNGYGVIARCVAGVGSVDARGNPKIEHIYSVALVPKFKPTKGVALDTTLVSGVIGTEAPHSARVDYRVL